MNNNGNVVQLFAVFDGKSRLYNQVFTAINDAVAVRDIQTLGANSKSPLVQFASDYTLYRLGHVDLSSGSVVALKDAVHIVDFKSLFPSGDVK